MSLRRFSLIPFPNETPGPGVAIAGRIERRATVLSMSCDIHGDLSRLAIPARVEVPERRDRLWEGTCLEFFLGADGSAGYWEFNLSPAGHWNVYHFASFRDGMREETAFASLPFRVWRDTETFRLSLDLDIAKIIPADRAVDAAVCAVVRTGTGETSHWALTHHGPRPDFHRREGFVLRL